LTLKVVFRKFSPSKFNLSHCVYREEISYPDSYIKKEVFEGTPFSRNGADRNWIKFFRCEKFFVWSNFWNFLEWW